MIQPANIFVMNAINKPFANNEFNPIRSWFGRMIDYFAFMAQDYNINWGDIEISIVMHSDLWRDISYLYSFDSYYQYKTNQDGDVFDGKNKYHTENTVNARLRHERYLSQSALPIRGRIYPVVLDDKISVSDINFVSNFIFGCIKNVKCEIL